MKVAICSTDDRPELKKVLTKYGFKVVAKDPDIVISYGGDGTILFSERKYPTIPKIILKKTRVCRKCDYTYHDIDNILKKVKAGQYTIVEEMKLTGYYKRNKLTALNEVQVHTKLPIRAIRFSVSVDGKKYENLVGDGVIVATPFGSTGYYMVTGGSEFKQGIGISFNNLYGRKIPSFVVPEDSVVKITMDRDTALLLADNNDEEYFELDKGDVVTIKKSKEKARFIRVE
jgi:NAD+ kinase